MNKEYKVSYKIYFETRLAKVKIGRVRSHPMYVHITYQRKNIYFKSAYFDFYGYRETPPVTLAEIEKAEKAMVEFIIQESKEFSLEQFKADYRDYSKDLTKMMETALRASLQVFFLNEGFTTLAHAVANYKNSDLILFVSESRIFLRPVLVKKLNTLLHSTVPYLRFQEFLSKENKENTLITIYDWEAGYLKKEFTYWLQKNYPEDSAANGVTKIDRLLSTHQREIYNK